MDDMIVNRLASLGYTVTDEDAWAITFCTDKVENHIKNACNITSIPDGLIEVAIDMICGEFLTIMFQTGKLDETFNLEMAVKSVQTGDTNVSFDTSASPEARFAALLNYLLNRGVGDLICYRKLKW